MSRMKTLGACLALVLSQMVPGAAQASHSARRIPHPVTLCGPGLAYFCPIRGFFDARPFHYNLAIYPGCIKWVRVETPEGLRRQPVLVCG